MDHTLRIWNTKTKQLLQTLKGHDQRVICCSISPNNEFIISGNQCLFFLKRDKYEFFTFFQAQREEKLLLKTFVLKIEKTVIKSI